MSEKLRLRDVDPNALARELAQSAHDALRDLTSLLGPNRLDNAMRILAMYARGEELAADVVERQLEFVGQLYRSPLGAATLPTSEPTTAFELVLAAVRARLSLDAGRDIGAQELAILAGLNWPYISQLAAAGAIPGAHRVGKEQDKRRPWRFRATKALKKWIDDKNT